MFGLNLLLAKLTSFIMFAAAGPSPGANCTITHQVFFIIPPWWEYLGGKYDQLLQCSPDFQLPNDILPVGLAVLDMLLRLAGFIAVVGIIIAGVEYITATGNTEKITNARKRWINALTGLAIALVASAVVSFLGQNLVKP